MAISVTLSIKEYTQRAREQLPEPSSSSVLWGVRHGVYSEKRLWVAQDRNLVSEKALGLWDQAGWLCCRLLQVTSVDSYRSVCGARESQIYLPRKINKYQFRTEVKEDLQGAPMCAPCAGWVMAPGTGGWLSSCVLASCWGGMASSRPLIRGHFPISPPVV